MTCTFGVGRPRQRFANARSAAGNDHNSIFQFHAATLVRGRKNHYVVISV